MYCSGYCAHEKADVDFHSTIVITCVNGFSEVDPVVVKGFVPAVLDLGSGGGLGCVYNCRIHPYLMVHCVSSHHNEADSRDRNCHKRRNCQTSGNLRGVLDDRFAISLWKEEFLATSNSYLFRFH